MASREAFEAAQKFCIEKSCEKGDFGWDQMVSKRTMFVNKDLALKEVSMVARRICEAEMFVF